MITPLSTSFFYRIPLSNEMLKLDYGTKSVMFVIGRRILDSGPEKGFDCGYGITI